MATAETSGRRKASKRPFPAAASEAASNGPVLAAEATASSAKKAKAHEASPSKAKVKKENDGMLFKLCFIVVDIIVI